MEASWSRLNDEGCIADASDSSSPAPRQSGTNATTPYRAGLSKPPLHEPLLQSIPEVGGKPVWG